MTTPAWMSVGTGGPVLATGGSQQKGLSGVQQDEGLPSTTATTSFAVIPPLVGRGRRITTPAWTSAWTRGPAPSSGGIQQQASRRLAPRRGRTEPLSQPVIQVWPGRASSGDRPLPRPRTGSKHGSPSIFGRSIIVTLLPPYRGVLRRRQRFISPCRGGRYTHVSDLRR